MTQLDFQVAFFAQAPRHFRAEAIGIKPELPFRKWVARQRRDYLPGPKRKRAGLIINISAPVAKVLQVVGRGRYPLFRATSMSVDLFELWRSISMRRMESDNWEIVSSREIPAVSHGQFRRFLKSPLAEELGPITLPGGTTLQAPSGDENVPVGSPKWPRGVARAP